MTSRKKGILRSVVWALFTFLIFALQAMVLPRVPIFGIKVQLLPILVAAAAVFGGVVRGGLTGLLAGVLSDISANEPTILFTLTLCFTGLFIGYICETLLVRSFPIYLFMSALALTVCAAAEIARPLVETLSLQMLEVAGMQIALSFIFVFPLYFMIRAVNRIDG